MPDAMELLSDRVASLSGRQRAVLRLVSRDCSSKEIGRELGLSEETVKNHIKAALRKLGVATRYDAARAVRLVEDADLRVLDGPARVIAVSVPGTDLEDGAGVLPNRETECVRERRTAFETFVAPSVVASGDPPRSLYETSTGNARRTGLGLLQIVAWIALTTAAMAIAGVAAAPLAQSAQHIADLVEKPRPSR